MNVFDKRPLSLILCVALGGFVIFSCSEGVVKVLILALAALFLISAVVYSVIKRKASVLALICALVFLIAILLSFLYFDCYFILDDTDKLTFVGTVTEINNDSGMRSLKIKTDEISTSVHSNYNILIYASLEESTNISVGSRIEVSAIPDEADENAEIFYYSEGISATVSEINSIKLVGYSEPGIGYNVNQYRESVCRRIILNSDYESGSLLCALLLGERDYMDGETVLDFMRTGLTHILALSGMHLAILSFALTKFLGIFSINKKLRKVIEIIFVIAYMALTGFPVSVVRAGIMLIISSILFLLAHRSDSITNLFISVFIIILIEPYAVFDIGLWLSALATLGILILTETGNKREEYKRTRRLSGKIFSNVLFSLLSSVFAISSTLLISYLSFGYISVISLVSTPIFYLLITPFLCIGVIFAIIGDVLQLGLIIRWFGSLIIEAVRYVSSINDIYFSAEYVIVCILVICTTLALIIFSVCNFKKKLLGIITTSVLVLAVFVSAFAAGTINKAEEKFEYNLSGASEWILINSGKSTTVIDMSRGGTKSAKDAHYIVSKHKYTEIAQYVYTDYHDGMVYGIDELVSSIFIENIYVPEPANDTEIRIYERIVSATSSGKASLIKYSVDDVIHCSDFTFYSAYRSLDEKNKFAFSILHGDDLYTYLSSGMLEDDTKNVATKLISDVDTLILGRHGNQYSNYSFIYQIEGIERIILSSQNLYIPNDTVEYYKETEIIPSPERISLIR